jgi:hypothetical protein
MPVNRVARKAVGDQQAEKPRWADLQDSEPEDSDDEEKQPSKRRCREDIRSNGDLPESPPLHADSYIATPSQSFDGWLPNSFGNAMTLSDNGVQPSDVSLASNCSASGRQPDVNGNMIDLQRSTTQARAPQSEPSGLQYPQHPPGVLQQNTLFLEPLAQASNIHAPAAAATCITGGVVDGEWPRRHEKRKRIVSSLKASPEFGYDVISSLRSRDQLPWEGPRTPDAFDSSISKRDWEHQVKNFKDFHRQMTIFLQG